jgi:hypothetical protein
MILQPARARAHSLAVRTSRRKFANIPYQGTLPLKEAESSSKIKIAGNYDASNVWVYTGSWVRATGSTSLTPGEAMWILITTPATLRP